MCDEKREKHIKHKETKRRDRGQRQEYDAFKAKHDQYVSKLEEAQEIVSTPEKTREFANMIKEGRQDLALKKQEIAYLKNEERST